jgi:hypothetical protein
MDNSQGHPHLILQTIRSQVLPRRTSQRIIPQLFHILRQRIYPMDGELVDGIDLTMHCWWYVPRVILTLNLNLDTRNQRSRILDRNKLPESSVRADCLATNTEYCDRCTHAATQATNVARIKTEGTKGLLQGQMAG